MSAVLGFLLGPIGRYVVLALALAGAVAWLRSDAASDAVTDAKAKRLGHETKRVEDATKADDASRKCAADPACRMSDDGWRRD